MMNWLKLFPLLRQTGVNLIEVCCSATSGLTERIFQKGGRAYRVGLENHMDMSTDVGYLKASDFANALRPEWMWFSLPCGPNSPVQNWNQKKSRTNQETSRKREGKPKESFVGI